MTPTWVYKLNNSTFKDNLFIGILCIFMNLTSKAGKSWYSVWRYSGRDESTAHGHGRCVCCRSWHVRRANPWRKNQSLPRNRKKPCRLSYRRSRRSVPGCQRYTTISLEGMGCGRGRGVYKTGYVTINHSFLWFWYKFIRIDLYWFIQYAACFIIQRLFGFSQSWSVMTHCIASDVYIRISCCNRKPF